MKHRYVHLPLLFCSLLVSGSGFAQIVINEVDYDQIGTDNAEFIEIKNIGEVPFSLQGVKVVFINGNGGGAVEYRTVQSAAWPDLAPGDYFVICGDQGLTLNCDHVATPATNLIQNGAPDAIALVSIDDAVVHDMLSYGGDVPDHTEGTGTTAQDSNLQDGLSLCRWPDGSDTDDNNADFVIGCPTPGESNRLDPVACSLTTGISGGLPGEGIVLLPDVVERRIELSVQQRAAAAIDVSVFAAHGTLVATHYLGTTASGQWRIPLGATGQLYLVRVRIGDEVWLRRVMMP